MQRSAIAEVRRLNVSPGVDGVVHQHVRDGERCTGPVDRSLQEAESVMTSGLTKITSPVTAAATCSSSSALTSVITTLAFLDDEPSLWLVGRRGGSTSEHCTMYGFFFTW
jgi:hypothetical protein